MKKKAQLCHDVEHDVCEFLYTVGSDSVPPVSLLLLSPPGPSPRDCFPALELQAQNLLIAQRLP